MLGGGGMVVTFWRAEDLKLTLHCTRNCKLAGLGWFLHIFNHDIALRALLRRSDVCLFFCCNFYRCKKTPFLYTPEKIPGLAETSLARQLNSLLFLLCSGLCHLSTFWHH